jgi:hypothetical protein
MSHGDWPPHHAEGIRGRLADAVAGISEESNQVPLPLRGRGCQNFPDDLSFEVWIRTLELPSWGFHRRNRWRRRTPEGAI